MNEIAIIKSIYNILIFLSYYRYYRIQIIKL